MSLSLNFKLNIVIDGKLKKTEFLRCNLLQMKPLLILRILLGATVLYQITTIMSSKTQKNVQYIKNVEISHGVKSMALNRAQYEGLRFVRTLARYLDGYTFKVETAEENLDLAESNAYLEENSNVIHINIEAGNAKGGFGDYAITEAMTHEIGHAIRKDAPRLYEELKSFIKENFYSEGGWDSAVSARQSQYKGKIGEFAWAKAEEEVVCNSLGRMLASQRVMNKLAKGHRTLFGRIWKSVIDFLDRLISRIQGVTKYSNKTTEQRVVEESAAKKQKELEKLFVTALREANTAARAIGDVNAHRRAESAKSGENSAVKTTDGSNKAKTAENDTAKTINGEKMQVSEGERSYSIIELDNGMQYVVATEKQIIKGNDSTKWAQQVATYINNVVRGNRDFVIKTAEGDFLTITRDTAYKAGTRNSVKNPDGTYRQMTDTEYRVKINAEIHINELAQTSRKIKRPNVPDYKNHKFATDGFSYRTAYFKDFDGEYYKLTISVGENGNISTVYNVGKIKKDTLPSGKIVSTFSGSKANNVSSTNSIPDSGEKSNSFAENSLEKYSDKSYSLTDNAIDVDNTSGERYNNFGWVRANGVLSVSENERVHSEFMKAKKRLATYPQSKNGEYMIAVGDTVDNKIVYVKGTVEDPIITRVLEIDLNDETKLSYRRKEIYEAERRGIQAEAGGIYRRYSAFDFGNQQHGQGIGRSSRQNNQRIGAYGSGSGRKTQRIKEILFDDSGNEIKRSYSLADSADREALAEAFYNLAATDEERIIVRQYRDELRKVDEMLADRTALARRYEELKGVKGMAAERTRVNAQIYAINDFVTRHDKKLLELSSAAPFREMMRLSFLKCVLFVKSHIDLLTFSKNII